MVLRENVMRTRSLSLSSLTGPTTPRSVANQVKPNKVNLSTSFPLFQFPEESCVDESDKLCLGYASQDSASSNCSEVENAFYPLSGSFDSCSMFSVQNPFLTPTMFSPTLTPLTYSTLCAPNQERILSQSAFFPLLSAGNQISLFNPRVVKKIFLWFSDICNNF